MLQRIAVVSDVHGVLPALDAVLAEPDVNGADLIVVTGDIAAGPQPAEVLDRLDGLGERVLLVRGNADRDLVTIARDGDPPDGTPPIDVWAAQRLTDEHVRVLDALPHPVVLPLDRVGEVLFCHGSPRDDNEVVLVDTRLSRWSEVLTGVPESVRMVVCGHTHMPFVRLVDRRWIVNSGSIGMPYGSRGLPWTLLTGSGVQLRWTSIDTDLLADEVVAACSYPNVEGWVDSYIRNPLSDAVAVEAFGPRDTRRSDWNEQAFYRQILSASVDLNINRRVRAAQWLNPIDLAAYRRVTPRLLERIDASGSEPQPVELGARQLRRH